MSSAVSLIVSSDSKLTVNFGKGVRQLSLTVRTETMDESPAGYQVVSCNSQGMQFLFPVK